MRLILEAGTDCRRENFLISNKVAVIILDKYGNANFHDIVDASITILVWYNNGHFIAYWEVFMAAISTSL